MRKKISFLILSVTFILVLVISPMTVAANNGGEVQTKGLIGFYEEDSSTKQSSTTKSSSDEPRVKKPVGRYPSTGEMVKASLGLSGAVLLVIGLLLFLWKRKKEGRDNT